MNFGTRLKKVRVASGVTQEELAGRLGTTKQAISRYENSNREPNVKTAKRIAEAFGVTLEELLRDEPSVVGDTPRPHNLDAMTTLRKVPRLGAIACGEPILAEQNIESYDSVPEYVNADFTLVCRGDSMINARIFDGDIVCIRQQPVVSNGEIAAVLIGEEATLKRVRLFPDHIVLEPENPTYRPLVYWGEEMGAVRIIGKATHFISNVR